MHEFVDREIKVATKSDALIDPEIKALFDNNNH